MKLYNYQNYIDKPIDKPIDHENIKYFLSVLRIKYYTINPDRSVDVDDDVDLYGRSLKELPFKFGKINGTFDCRHNKLTTLKNSPNQVIGRFACSSNELKTLEHGPKIVNNHYNCEFNQLINLKGFPDYCQGYFFSAGNPIYEITRTIPENKLIEFTQLINEYDAIRDKKIIIRDRLEAAYEGAGIEIPDILNIKGYKII